jgi:murein DD-endopeptidase MepM/ murein hydrolase activator NlpD
MHNLMILLLTDTYPLFIIAAMDLDLSIPPLTPDKSAYPSVNMQALSNIPIEGRVEQLLVTLLLAATLSKIGLKTPEPYQSRNLSINSCQSVKKPQTPPLIGSLTQEFHSCHVGIDIGVPIGTPVKATMDGNVIYAGWNTEGYGNLVVIQNCEYKTYYAHLSIIPVNAGESVRTGMTIALSGSSGNSTGPHLHYEVRINDRPIDPRIFNGSPAE